MIYPTKTQITKCSHDLIIVLDFKYISLYNGDALRETHLDYILVTSQVLYRGMDNTLSVV